MRVIETEYKNYLFRSRLEARWAVFFDKAGIEWEYEPEGFVLDDGTWYLPDFFLKNINGENLWVEVKGNLSELDKKKICQIGSCVCVGNIPDSGNVFEYMKDVMKQMEENEGFVFSKSRKVPSILVANESGELGIFGEGHEFSYEKTEKIILPALKAARQERFESERRKADQAKAAQKAEDAKTVFTDDTKYREDAVLDYTFYARSNEIFREMEKECETIDFDGNGFDIGLKCEEISKKYQVDQKIVKRKLEEARKNRIFENNVKVKSSKEWVNVLLTAEVTMFIADYMLISNPENISGVFDNGIFKLYPKNSLMLELLEGENIEGVERSIHQAFGAETKIEICIL